MKLANVRASLGLGLAAILAASVPASAGTVQAIMDRGQLNCPVAVGGYPGSSELDDQGNWHGMDIDFCRAIAVALLGDPAKANFIPLSWAQRFPSLAAGDIDLIVMGTGITMSRDTTIGLDFTSPYYFTGVQFLVPADSEAEVPSDLEGGVICSTTGTTIERDITTYMRANNIEYSALTFERTEQASTAFMAGRCDAIGDIGQALAVLRLGQDNPEAYKIIPENTITLGATGMAVRQGDYEMLDVANWVLQALLHADVHGLTAENVDEMAISKKDDPQVAALLGLTPGIGDKLGLRNEWAYDVIKAFGSHQAIYDRSLGKNSRYGIPAGYSRLYTDGGLLFPIPLD